MFLNEEKIEFHRMLSKSKITFTKTKMFRERKCWTEGECAIERKRKERKRSFGVAWYKVIDLFR
jgi:hypothetical protein